MDTIIASKIQVVAFMHIGSFEVFINLTTFPLIVKLHLIAIIFSILPFHLARPPNYL
jgi:hypothetical protein